MPHTNYEENCIAENNTELHKHDLHESSSLLIQQKCEKYKSSNVLSLMHLLLIDWYCTTAVGHSFPMRNKQSEWHLSGIRFKET